MRAPAAPRVVHIVPALFGAEGIIGGAERYAFELARHMAARTETSLVTFADRAGSRSAGALRINLLGPSTCIRGQRANPIARGLIRAVLDADVVHCHQQHVLASSVAALAGRLARKKLFVTDLGGGGWDISAYVSTDRWYHGHLHISQYSRRLAKRDDPGRHFVISGGVDTERFSPGAGGHRDDTIRFVGRILPHKGLADLIDAVGSDLALEIIGPAPDPAYVECLRERARGTRVTFITDLDDDALVERYRTALCVVLPSVYRAECGGTTLVPELLGQTLLEAMACETAVIGTDVASLPEVIADGITGFLVAPNNPARLREKLLWLKAHAEHARTMGRAGRQRVIERFTWKQVVSRCLAIYAGASPASVDSDIQRK